MQASGNWLPVEVRTKRQRLDRYAQGSDDDEEDDEETEETVMRNTVVESLSDTIAVTEPPSPATPVLRNTVVPTDADQTTLSDTLVLDDASETIVMQETTFQQASAGISGQVDDIDKEISAIQEVLNRKIHYLDALREFNLKIGEIAASDGLVLTVRDSNLISSAGQMGRPTARTYGEIECQFVAGSLLFDLFAFEEPVVEFSVLVTAVQYNQSHWSWVRWEDETRRNDDTQPPIKSRPPKVGDTIRLYSIYTNTQFITLRAPEYNDPDYINLGFVFLASSIETSETKIYLN